ncbi:hypothetical protein [Massilia sp. PWRC2]|uniref:hypothetical protein n=1 Tax=Massilia sp. PWRC2 TaxID=2804626 RepID=UPI003CEAE549
MRYSKHNKTAEIAKLPRAMLVGGAAAIIAVAAFLTLTASTPSTRKVLPEFRLPTPPLMNSAPARAADKPLRLVYRNSVVPGGVHSAAELSAVIARDPVAAAHYADFKVAAAHLVQVENSRMVHVSYRIGNQIYWTKNKVRLALGESLLSDGEHLIRARCGNRIADTIEGPVLLNEPPPEVLETAFVSAEDLIDQTVSMAALGGMPLLPAPGNPVAPSALAAVPATPPLAERFGPPALIALPGVPTLPGVTVLGPRAAPAVLIDAVSPALLPTSTPVPPTSTPLTITPLPLTPTALTPVLPATPLFPVLDTVPAAVPALPIDVATRLPPAAAPEAPFIEAPTFTPVRPLAATPEATVTVPEPNAALLAVLALAVLAVARRLRRRR